MATGPPLGRTQAAGQLADPMNLVWNFKIGADRGTILFDNYQEYRFNGLK